MVKVNALVFTLNFYSEICTCTSTYLPPAEWHGNILLASVCVCMSYAWYANFPNHFIFGIQVHLPKIRLKFIYQGLLKSEVVVLAWTALTFSYLLWFIGIILGSMRSMHTPHFMEWGYGTPNFYELSQKNNDANLSIWQLPRQRSSDMSK